MVVVNFIGNVHLLLHGHDTTGSLVSDLEDGEVLVWIVLISILWDHVDRKAIASDLLEVWVTFLTSHELGSRSTVSDLCHFGLLHLVLFELRGELISLLHSLLSFDEILLRLVVEESDGEANEDESEKNDGDHDDDPGCGAIISLLNLDNSWIKFVLLHDLLDGDVLVNGVLFKNGLDVWSEDRLSSGNSVDVLNVIDDSCSSCGVGGCRGDDDWVVTISRDSSV